MNKYLILGIMLITVGGCHPAYNSNTASFDQTGGAPAGWEAAYTETDKACGICEKKHKTRYAITKCKLVVMDQHLSPYFPNKAVYEDYKTKRLLLAIKQDKKEVTKDEADVLSSDLYNKMVAAENTTLASIYAQNAANAQAQDQYQNMVHQKMLGAMAEPFNAQKAWIDQQNQQNRSIHCTTFGNTTNCQQY